MSLNYVILYVIASFDCWHQYSLCLELTSISDWLLYFNKNNHNDDQVLGTRCILGAILSSLHVVTQSFLILR